MSKRSLLSKTLTRLSVLAKSSPRSSSKLWKRLTGRAPRPSFGQMIFEDARSRYPQVPPAQVAPEPAPAPVPEPPEPGSDEELLQNIYAQRAAEAERMSRAAEVFDTPPENPEGTILQDTTERTTGEVLAGQTPGRRGRTRSGQPSSTARARSNPRVIPKKTF